MSRTIGAINMTLDGYCDHTAIIPDDEMHEHFSNLMRSADIVLFGRITFQLMEYWKELVTNPSGDKAMDDFALSIDRVPKVVFSRTLDNVDWGSARVARQNLEEEIQSLRQQQDHLIFVSSRSLIIGLINLGLLDELQLTVHPVIAGEGLLLFDLIKDKTTLKLVKTVTFGSGAVTFYYDLK